MTKRKSTPVIEIEMMAASFYRHIDPRYKQRIADYDMISEDKECIANLSEKEINRVFNASRKVEKLSDGF